MSSRRRWSFPTVKDVTVSYLIDSLREGAQFAAMKKLEVISAKGAEDY